MFEWKIRWLFLKNGHRSLVPDSMRVVQENLDIVSPLG